jgi:hypothetical protein
MFCEERVYLGSGGHGGLRAAAGYRDGGGRTGKARCRPRVLSLEKCHRKCAVEAIAGAYGVNGVHFEGWHPGCVATGDGDVRSFGTAFEGYTFEASVKEVLCGVLGL